jgi:hypothetical protein
VLIGFAGACGGSGASPAASSPGSAFDAALDGGESGTSLPSDAAAFLDRGPDANEPIDDATATEDGPRAGEPVADAPPATYPVDGADTGTSQDSSASDGAMEAASMGEPAGIFVAVGYGGRRMRSIDDGRTWSDDQSLEPNGGDDMDLLRTVTFGAGKFIAAGWQTFASPDGRTWSTLPATHQNWFGALAFADPLWVAVGGYGMRLTSSDAVTWMDHSIDTTAAHAHGCLVFTQAPVRRFVACNDNGARSYSSDGAMWVYASGALDVRSSQLATGAGVVVGIDGAEVALSRDAGQTWRHTATLDSTGGGLVFAQGHFSYLATDAVYTSTDGSTWERHVATGVRPSSLAYGHGTYVAVGAHQWHRSPDGIVWPPPTQDTSQTNAFEWVTFGASAR